MKIEIKSCLKGAKEARGIAVIIDVFRASNTIIACLAQGAEYIVPVSDLEEAYELKRKNEEYLLFGERKGLPQPGFDFGNSPAKSATLPLKGKRIILTTSAGSQGIVHATNSDAIIIGSFANAAAVTTHILSKNPDRVSLMAIGLEAHTKAAEDELCAAYIKESLLGGHPDYGSMKEKILQGDGAQRLRNLGQEDDLEYCLKVDITGVVPFFDKKYQRIKI